MRTLAKPVSKKIKNECSQYPTTQNLLIRVGQTTHRVTSRLKIWSAGYKVRSIAPLSPDEALLEGAEILGESFIFFVAGGVAVLDYSLSKQKERERVAQESRQVDMYREQIQAALKSIDAKCSSLEHTVQQQRQSIITLEEKISTQEKEKFSFSKFFK